MKIRTKLSLRYTMVTATIFLLFVAVVYFATERNREVEFFHDLRKEAVTKANLFLQNKADASTMQSIYLNNREFLDEVEVAIYDTSFSLLYHDAKEIDLVKETPSMIQTIVSNGEIHFYQDDYQVVGILYPYHGMNYIVTAAAYDGYGFAKLERIGIILSWLCIVGILLLSVVGYYLAKSALLPVAHIVDEVEKITATNLDARVHVKNEHDELGELATTFNIGLNRLEQSFESQKMFVSNVSHELRTPLAALVGELEITLLKERTNDEYRTTIKNTLIDSQKIAKLSSGLLDLAKAGYDSRQIVMKKVRLDEVLLDARELVVRANESFCVDLLFEQEADDDSLITVMGNEYLLRTAFVNLIENNCKFSVDKTSSVRISFFEYHSILRFSDTGIGIPEEDIKQLFVPFYRGENRHYAPGNGIGMTLIQKVITLHGGEIRVNSHVGEGTVFTIKLPHI